MQISMSMCIYENAHMLAKMRAYVQFWVAQLSAGIRAAKLGLLSGGGTAAEPVKCKRFVRTFARRRDPVRVVRLRRVYTSELFAMYQDQGFIPVVVTPKTEWGAVIQSDTIQVVGVVRAYK